MLTKLSKSLTNVLLSSHQISSDDYDIYQYGFELLISSIVTISFILLLSVILHILPYGIIYLFVSIPLRTYAGGYHASTYSRCFIISNLYYLLVLGIFRLLSLHMIHPFLWILLLLISVSFIAFFSPIRNSNHPITASTLRRSKYKVTLFLVIDCITIIFFYSVIDQTDFLNFSILTILSVAILMLPHIFKERGTHICFTANL